VSIVLFRVDERLVHGQVTVGWGMRLRPALYVTVDDALAGGDWEQELWGSPGTREPSSWGWRRPGSDSGSGRPFRDP
jgi:hypothetical protein